MEKLEAFAEAALTSRSFSSSREAAADFTDSSDGGCGGGDEERGGEMAGEIMAAAAGELTSSRTLRSTTVISGGFSEEITWVEQLFKIVFFSESLLGQLSKNFTTVLSAQLST